MKKINNIKKKNNDNITNNSKNNNNKKSTIKDNSSNDIDDLNTEIFNFYHEALEISKRVQASLDDNNDNSTTDNTYDLSYFKGNNIAS